MQDLFKIKDNVHTIDRFFSKREYVTGPLPQVSRFFNNHVTQSLWRQAGAKSYDDFLARMKALPRVLQRLFLDGEKYQLAQLEAVAPFISQTPDERLTYILDLWSGSLPPYFGLDRLQLLLSSYFWILALQQGLMNHKDTYIYRVDYLTVLFTEPGFHALSEGLITIGAGDGLNTGELKLLLSTRGRQALREQLITLTQVHQMNGKYLLSILISDWGLNALRRQWITPEQVINLSEGFGGIHKIQDHLQNEAGCRALSKGLITLNHLPTLSSGHLNVLLSPRGLRAMEAGHLTANDVVTYSLNVQKLKVLTSDACFSVLNEKWITPEQAKQCAARVLKALTSELGIQALRGQWIKPEQAATLDARVLDTLLMKERGFEALSSGRITLSMVANLDIAELEELLDDTAAPHVLSAVI